VLVSGGAVKCWGWNDYGELGIGSTAQQNSPADVNLGSGAGYVHAVVMVALRRAHRKLKKRPTVDVGLGSGKQGALSSAPTSYGVGGGGFIHWHRILRSLMGWCGQSVRTLFWVSLH
jgi:hypothetical protein